MTIPIALGRHRFLEFWRMPHVIVYLVTTILVFYLLFMLDCLICYKLNGLPSSWATWQAFNVRCGRTVLKTRLSAGNTHQRPLLSRRQFLELADSLDYFSEHPLKQGNQRYKSCLLIDRLRCPWELRVTYVVKVSQNCLKTLSSVLLLLQTQ